MCKTHNKVFGKEAVVLFAEARILNNVCEARYKYLQKQAMSFHAWAGAQSWCDDADQLCKNIVAQVEKLLKEQGPTGDTLARPDDELSDILVNTNAEADDFELRSDDEHSAQEAYWGMLHNIAIKAENNTKLEVSTELFEAIRSFLDKLEPHVCVEDYSKTHPKTKMYLSKVRQKVNFHHFKTNVLVYSHWTYLMNWLNALMGIEKQYNNEEQGVVANYDAQDAEKFGIPEDLEEDVRLVWYSRD